MFRKFINAVKNLFYYARARVRNNIYITRVKNLINWKWLKGKKYNFQKNSKK